MNKYVVHIPGLPEIDITADAFTVDTDANTLEFLDEDENQIAVFAWGAGVYIMKEGVSGRTNSASA